MTLPRELIQPAVTLFVELLEAMHDGDAGKERLERAAADMAAARLEHEAAVKILES